MVTIMGNDINSLSGVEFENLCQQLIEKMGFSVDTTKASGDGGIDLIAHNDQPILSGKYIIQCKRYSGSVGEPIIRDLFGVVTSERANKGILMTTGYFTKSAVSFADGKPIELIDGDKIIGLLQKYNISMMAGINDAHVADIEREFNGHNTLFRKSFNRFDSETNAFLFDVNDNGLYDDISTQYVTIRIYEAVQMAIFIKNESVSQIALFYSILKCMGMNTVNIGECESIYYKFLKNEDGYKDILYNTAMPHENDSIGKFWMNLMIAAGMYDIQSSLRELIDFHKIYMVDLLEAMKNFGIYDTAINWIEDYENSLDLLKDSL